MVEQLLASVLLSPGTDFLIVSKVLQLQPSSNLDSKLFSDAFC